MDFKTPVQTSYGEVPLQTLLDAFEKKKQYEQAKKEWLKTDAGKEYQRKKAKDYYNRHRDQVLAKRAARYEKDSETLINRAKEYYAAHSEECKEKNKQRRLRKQGVSKVEPAEA